MVLSGLFGRKRKDDNAHRLYLTLAGQARQPVFYGGGGVADTLDGRFDMLALHMFLILRRLSGQSASPAEAQLAQILFDVMFGDMDRSLREMGVGDLTVGRKIREMADAFYGRAEAYETGIAAEDGNASLSAALTRNLYRGNAPAPLVLSQMADYIRQVVAGLGATATSDFLRGEISFPAPPKFQ